MADDIEAAFQTAAKTIAGYVANVSTLKVTTQYVRAGTNADDIDFSTAKPLAQTTIELDADCTTILPVTSPPGSPLQIDSTLFELHERNVNTATEYRARVLSALVTALQGWVQAIRS